MERLKAKDSRFNESKWILPVKLRVLLPFLRAYNAGKMDVGGYVFDRDIQDLEYYSYRPHPNAALCAFVRRDKRKQISGGGVGLNIGFIYRRYRKLKIIDPNFCPCCKGDTNVCDCFD